MLKDFYKYDKQLDEADTEPREVRDFGNYTRNVKDVARPFLVTDFDDATVLDLGCSHGGVLEHVRGLGARRVLGVEYAPDAVASCRERDIQVIQSDLENIAMWRQLPPHDVVMCLAVWKTSLFSERHALMANAVHLAKKVLYWETHRPESKVQCVYYLLRYSLFTRFQCWPSDDRRWLIRCSYEQPNDHALIFKDENVRIDSDWLEIGVCPPLLTNA